MYNELKKLHINRIPLYKSGFFMLFDENSSLKTNIQTVMPNSERRRTVLIVKGWYQYRKRKHNRYHNLFCHMPSGPYSKGKRYTHIV